MYNYASLLTISTNVSVAMCAKLIAVEDTVLKPTSA